MTELLANRDEECSKLRDELRNNKNILEEERRNVKGKGFFLNLIKSNTLG